MKILFLDIDGVLNSLKWYKTRQLSEDRFENKNRSVFDKTCEEIDPEPLMILKDFIEENNISIVISSSWRLLMPHYEIKEVFSKTGWFEAPIVAATKYIPSFKRGQEIEQFLTDCEYDIEKYAIIDDDSDMTDHQKEFHFVKTEWKCGLKEEHIKKLEKILL